MSDVPEEQTNMKVVPGSKEFGFVVDGVDYSWPKPVITGAEIMAAAGISQSDGLVELLDDGTQQSLKPTSEIDLEPGHRFKKRPRFRRG